MKAEESGKHMTIWKYVTHHAVTRCHVPDHEIAKVY